MAKRTNWKRWNAWLTENYSKLSAKEIQEHIGCSMAAVRQQAHKLGLVKFPDDISFFENWTSESAYIIGLWAADGYANVRPGKGVAVSISQSHGGGICERIREIVGRGSVYYIPQHKSHRWTLHSRKFYEFLNEVFGQDVQAKSRTLQWPVSLPVEYERDFIRGYCDGDGHVSVSGRNRPLIRFYCGPETFRDALLERIEHWTGIEGTTSIAIGEVYLALYDSIKATCLAHWLYQPKDLAIPRKVEAAQEIVSIEQGRINKDSLTPKMREMFPEILDRYWKDTGQFLFATRKHGTHTGWKPRPKLEQLEFAFE
jgi:hypothetical protein